MSDLKRHNIRSKFGPHKGRFVTKLRETWVKNVVKARQDRNREAEKPAIVGYDAGRRIVELDTLGVNLWCNECDIPLSLRFIESETVNGLASTLFVRCVKCKNLHTVLTNKTHKLEGDIGPPRYAVNYKAAVAIIDSGSGEAQLNIILSALDVPTLTSTLLKRYERKIGVVIEAIAEQSCREAIALEKALTIAAKKQESSSRNGESHESEANPTDPLGMTAGIDAGWQKRGTGKSYNSLTGHSTLIGHCSKKVLSYTTRSKRCRKCELGHPKTDHDCRLSFKGSAKAMEPDMAVELVVKNPLLVEANVYVSTMIADDDSATLAEVRRESTHTIEKWSDFNHAKKGLANTLYSLKLPVKVIDYLTLCFAYAVKQNQGDVAATKEALQSIVPHAFGEHETCGEWCRYDPEIGEYAHANLLNGKPLSDPELRIKLDKVFQKIVNNAAKISPCGSTQGNESLNYVVSLKHPKNHHYACSESFQYRVAAAVSQKNLGSQYIIRVFEELGLSPGINTQRFREKKDRAAKRKAETKVTPAIKRRRLLNKQKRSSKNAAAENREGVTYSTDCALNSAADLIHDAPNLDDAVDYNDATAVVFDLETSGLSNSAEICQIAAACGDDSYDAYMLPTRGISSSASTVTGLTIVEGELFLDSVRVTTSPPRAAMEGFINFLINTSDNKGVILVAHNSFRFDCRVILRTVKKLGLLAEFKKAVKGFADTLILFRSMLPERKKAKQKFSQATLAVDYLGPTAIEGAHNAVQDVRVLTQLIAAIGLTSDQIKQGAKSVGQLIRERAMETIHASNAVSLEILKNGVSSGMRSKMAKAGITNSVLTEVFKDGGKEKVKMLLAEDIGGRPRVSKSEKVLAGVIRELEQLLSP